MPTSIKNNRGFTLTELMVAIVIILVGLLGLLQAINLTTDVNLKNHLRDEAVYVGEKYVNEIKGRGFDAIAPVPPASSVTFPVMSTASRIRGRWNKLKIETSTSVLSRDELNKPTTLQLMVVVKWTYKGVGYENRVSVPVSAMPL